jgi:hypothetical protein
VWNAEKVVWNVEKVVWNVGKAVWNVDECTVGVGLLGIYEVELNSQTMVTILVVKKQQHYH